MPYPGKSMEYRIILLYRDVEITYSLNHRLYDINEIQIYLVFGAGNETLRGMSRLHVKAVSLKSTINYKTVIDVQPQAVHEADLAKFKLQNGDRSNLKQSMKQILPDINYKTVIDPISSTP
ncbi:hypothetical protein ElyMa_003459900 [Elysia marginata]|uniref:Uncharacterized protein n=1 Tax=Elysia marginata TaxID=1093978 RepID=A0AAV4EAA1_9GAST|nr:hypothetical protein ElyMa_003459900 [Elysia marginata]